MLVITFLSWTKIVDFVPQSAWNWTDMVSALGSLVAGQEGKGWDVHPLHCLQVIGPFGIWWLLGMYFSVSFGNDTQTHPLDKKLSLCYCVVGKWQKQSGSCCVDAANTVLRYGKMETLATVSNVLSSAVYHMDYLLFPVHISWASSGLVGFVDA